jgi:hypothetical protein
MRRMAANPKRKTFQVEKRVWTNHMAQMHEASFAESWLASAFLANWHAAEGEETGGGRGGRGGAQGGQTSKPKKENILDLSKYMDKEISVKFSGGKGGDLPRHRLLG